MNCRYDVMRFVAATPHNTGDLNCLAIAAVHPMRPARTTLDDGHGHQAQRLAALEVGPEDYFTGIVRVDGPLSGGRWPSVGTVAFGPGTYMGCRR